MNEADKEEIRKVFAQLQPVPKSRLSTLLLKVGLGFAALAVFTTAALLYSSVNLYAVNSTARKIVDIDLRVVASIIKIRSSLLAQENFAGKYAIFRDPAFIHLFRQRNEDVLGDLAVLENSSIPNVATLKALYQHYAGESEKLFAGTIRNREPLRASAQRLAAALDGLYTERLNALQTVLSDADEQQQSTTRWALGISCAGFLFGVFIAPAIIFRVIRAFGKLQQETRRVALGDLSHYPEVPPIAEIRELAKDFGKMAEQLRKVEQLNDDALPPMRLPGSVAIERILNERLKSGVPFSFCDLEIDNFQPLLAEHGYGKAGKLLDETGALIHQAVNDLGAKEDFVGHTGGERFVFVVAAERVEPVCEAVIQGFDTRILSSLGAEPSPITTLSITVLDCDVSSYGSALEIARAAAQARAVLKKGTRSRWEKFRCGEGDRS